MSHIASFRRSEPWEFKSALDCRTIMTLPTRVGGPVMPTRLAAVTISGSRGWAQGVAQRLQSRSRCNRPPSIY
jgi:hypothetical protein